VAYLAPESDPPTLLAVVDSHRKRSDEERDAVTALLAGEAIVLPTDTVYGVAVAAGVSGASERLFALKDRPAGVPVAVLVASFDQAAEVVELPPAGSSGERLLRRWWPGALTAVLSRRADVTWDLGGDGNTLGVRCPASELVQRLAAEVGPLATSSANRHGHPTAVTAAAAAAALVGAVAVVIDGGTLGGLPSTVVDLTGPEPVVLRAGAITAPDIAATIDVD
jgi:L-threonylcarbamoyladenylate synthase